MFAVNPQFTFLIRNVVGIRIVGENLIHIMRQEVYDDLIWI